MVKKRFDIIIVGGGLVGLIAAVSLARLGLSIKIVEKSKITKKYNYKKDIRTTAIAQETKNILEFFNLWKKIKKNAEPIKNIKVYDRTPFSKINFENKTKNSYLGYIVENKFIKEILIKEIFKNKNIYISDSTPVEKIEILQDEVIVKAKEDFTCSLLIAADGKKSFVANSLDQKKFFKNYNQTALVANIMHTQKHNNTAYEIFLKSGPIASLPMLDKNNKGFRSSIVWTNTSDYMSNLEKVDDNFLVNVLNEHVSEFLGQTKKIFNKQFFSLNSHINSAFFSKKVIYIGDSAHSIHPIAGQGWNVGMRDVRTLFNIIKNANLTGIDLGSEYVGQEYNKQRYFDAFSLYQITDKLNTLFMYDNFAFNKIRKIGFKLINNNTFINSKISDYAMGKRF